MSTEKKINPFRMADYLSRKPDIYYKGKRIYCYDFAFDVIGDELCYVNERMDVDAFTDGHGNKIAIY